MNVERVKKPADYVNLLVDRISALAPGTLIQWDQLRSWLDNKGKFEMYMLITRAKKRLIRDHSLFLENVKGDGYVLQTRGEEIKTCFKHHRQGVKQLHYAAQAASFINLQAIEDDTLRNKTIEGQQKLATHMFLISSPKTLK